MELIGCFPTGEEKWLGSSSGRLGFPAVITPIHGGAWLEASHPAWPDTVAIHCGDEPTKETAPLAFRRIVGATAWQVKAEYVPHPAVDT